MIFTLLRAVKQSEDFSVNQAQVKGSTCVPIVDQQQSLKYCSSKQPTDKIPQIGLEDVSGEQHTSEMVSKTDTGSSDHLLLTIMHTVC